MAERMLAGSRWQPGSFDPEATREGMRGLEVSGLSVATTPEQEYFDFYGLDFAGNLNRVVHHFGRVDAAGFAIACHYYAAPQPRGTCVLLHGYFDHAGLFARLIEHCLRRGYSVLIWDLPGHGLSSGPQASIHSFDDYIEVLGAMLERYGEVLPRPLVGIGQSTGAAVLLGWAFRRCRTEAECPFAKLALLAPLVRCAQWHRVSLGYHLLRPFRGSIAREFMANSSDEQFVAFVRNDPLQSRRLPVRWVGAMRGWVRDFMAHAPTRYAPIVVQGDEDQTVDWRWNLAQIREKFPGAPIRMVPGARHHLANEAPALREQVFAALEL